MPREVLDAMMNGLRNTEAALPDWPYFQADGEPLTGYQPLLRARTAVARFLGADADEVAITQNATMGMNALGNGIDWQAGDEVLTTDQEHGGAVSIFRLMAKRRGIVVKELPLASAVGGGPEGIVAMFRAAATPKTRAIMVSQITSQFGIKMPVVELIALARERGALSLIDGAQAVGQIRVNVRELGCDAYVASPHKWLMAPKGTGLLYVRQGVQEKFWTTLASYQWDNKEQGAFRFMQYGTGSTAIIDGLMAALALAERTGIDRVERWDLDPHEAPARRSFEDRGRGPLLARRIRASPRPSRRSVSKAFPPAICRTPCGRRRSACGRRATTRACVCRRMSTWPLRTSTASWRWYRRLPQEGLRRFGGSRSPVPHGRASPVRAPRRATRGCRGTGRRSASGRGRLRPGQNFRVRPPTPRQ